MKPMTERLSRLMSNASDADYTLKRDLQKLVSEAAALVNHDLFYDREYLSAELNEKLDNLAETLGIERE